MEFINDNPDKDWDWYQISKNPNITMKDILNNSDKHWNWREISMNQNITMKDINKALIEKRDNILTSYLRTSRPSLYNYKNILYTVARRLGYNVSYFHRVLLQIPLQKLQCFHLSQ